MLVRRCPQCSQMLLPSPRVQPPPHDPALPTDVQALLSLQSPAPHEPPPPGHAQPAAQMLRLGLHLVGMLDGSPSVPPPRCRCPPRCPAPEQVLGSKSQRFCMQMQCTHHLRATVNDASCPRAPHCRQLTTAPGTSGLGQSRGLRLSDQEQASPRSPVPEGGVLRACGREGLPCPLSCVLVALQHGGKPLPVPCEPVLSLAHGTKDQAGGCRCGHVVIVLISTGSLPSH